MPVHAHFTATPPTLSSAQHSGSIPLVLNYFSEGGANVIFTVKPSSACNTLPDLINHKVLRLRKSHTSNTSSLDVYNYYHSVISPLFDHRSLMVPELITISPDLIHVCNTELIEQERSSKRRELRHGSSIEPLDPYGVLLPDMTLKPGRTLTIEFKPKWLAQSPCAPKESRRCRTCALEAMRRAKSWGPGRHLTRRYCPLALSSGDPAYVRSVIDRLLSTTETEGQLGPEKRRSAIDALTLFFSPPSAGYTLIQQLLWHQLSLDPDGILSISSPKCGAITESLPVTSVEPPADFLTAMTLRDCSLFITLNLGGEDEHPEAVGPSEETRNADPKERNGISKVLEARLADLDPKNPSGGKLEMWARTERELLDGGWYTGREVKGRSTEDEICMLWKYNEEA